MRSHFLSVSFFKTVNTSPFRKVAVESAVCFGDAIAISIQPESRPSIAGYALRGVCFALPLLPPAPMPRLAAGRAGGGAELGAGLVRIGRLEDAAAALRLAVVGRGFARRRAVGAIGQGFRAVHFVEMGVADS